MKLAAVVAERGVSLVELSRLLGRNDAYVQQYVRRGSPRVLGERDRGLLARYLGIAEQELGAPPDATRTTVPVRRPDLAAAAGAGMLGSEDATGAALRFDPALLGAMGLSGGSAALLPVAGGSMAPTLCDGDMMLVDESDRRVGAAGGVYVLRLDDALVVKRLRREGRRIAILSDNPDYPAIAPRPPAEIDVIGRVVGLSRRL